MASYKAAVVMCLLLAVVAALPSSSLGSSGEVAEIMEICKSYILKKSGALRILERDDPCCEKVRGVDVKYICDNFTEEEKDKVNLFKWAMTCKICEKPLPADYDCRGYVVPADL
ncbi:hypothetical protein ACP4OV_006887 [Aristida adscensionis]